MRSFLSLVLIFLVASLSAMAQDQFVLSKRHQEKIDLQFNPVKKLRSYERFFRRDSIRTVKQNEKYWRNQLDSLNRYSVQRAKALKDKQNAVKDDMSSKLYHLIYKPWAKLQAARYIHILETNARISSSLKIILFNHLTWYFLEASQDEQMLLALKQKMPGLSLPKELDSKLNNYKILNPEKVAEVQQLASQKINGAFAGKEWYSTSRRISSINGKYGQYSKIFSNPDTAVNLAKSEANKFALEQSKYIEGIAPVNDFKTELEKAEGQLSNYQGRLSELQDSTYLKEQAKKKAEEMALNYIEDHPEVMKTVQAKMNLLMKKFSVVPNSNDLSSAIKRTSLKGKPLGRRLYAGANFQFVTLDPVCIDFSPMVGYRVNTSFLLGIGGTYRQSFSDTIPTLSPEVFGYKGFTSYNVATNFFAYAEFCRNSTGIEKFGDESKRIWKNAASLGIGRRIRINAKLEMTVVMLYNFLHENPDPVSPKPWSVRIGFQSSEFGFFKPR